MQRYCTKHGPRGATARLAVAGLLAAVALAGCRGPATAPGAPTPAPAAARPTVVATLFPLADIARTLAGDAAEVETLVRAGTSPHTFEMTPNRAASLRGAVLIVRVGPGLDQWLDAVLGSSRAPVVTAMEHTALLPGVKHDHDGAAAEAHDHGHEEEYLAHDPHVWLDPVRMRDDLAPAIAAGLQAALPAHADAIAQRLSELQARLTKLDQDIGAELANLATRRYVASHPGWQYFDRRYGLVLAATVEEVAGSEASARWMKHVIDVARREKVGAVFTEAQVSERTAQAVARETGLPIFSLDPLGGEGIAGRDSYEALLRYNAQQFAMGLRG